jgi:hypothetical protein
VGLRLVVGQLRTEGDGVAHGAVEVVHRQLEVCLHLLDPLARRPGGSLVEGLALDRDGDR